MRRPRSSTRVSKPPPFNASLTAFSISSGVWLLSSTSSRTAYCTPIFTSTFKSYASSAVVSRFARARETTDATPAQRREQLDGTVAVHVTRCSEPVARTDLGGPGETNREQLGFVLGRAGVLRDRRGDRIRALTQRALDTVADCRLVAQV